MCMLLITIYTKRPNISDGSMSETLSAGGSNMKESVSALAENSTSHGSSSSDSLVVNEDGSTEQLSIPGRTGITQDRRRT